MKKLPRKKKKLIARKGSAQTSTVFVLIFLGVILIASIFLTGGVDDLSKLNQNNGPRVIKIDQSPGPSTSGLQAQTFGSVTATPVPGSTLPNGISGTRNGKLRIALDGYGYNRNYISGLVNDFALIGITWNRDDVGDGSDITYIQNDHNLGIKSIVLYNVNMTGLSPGTVASQIKSLAQRIQPFGLNEIELGNEIYCNGCNGWATDPPAAYAAQYDAAHRAIAGMGITLIADSYGDYTRSDGSWSQDANGGGWIHDFIAGMPGGAGEIDAWSIHPYGPVTTLSSGDDGGWPMVQRLHDLAVQYGSDKPWYITEVGQCLGATPGHPAGCSGAAVSQQQQADAMTQYLNDSLTKYTWVTYLSWYEVWDDSSGEWGLFDYSGNTITGLRPSFNALKTWMSAHASQVDG